MPGFRYDVALSFAGEDRIYVDKVARNLRDRGIRVFYDQFEVVSLWGSDLVAHLDNVYRKQSRFVILFASRHYANKIWTSHERESAQARAVTEKGTYLLPVRFDETDIPGLRPTTGHLDARVLGPDDIARLMAEKIAADDVPALVNEAEFERKITRIPLKKEDNQELITGRPPGWEHMLLAGAIWQSTVKHESQLRDHELKYARRVIVIPDNIAINNLTEQRTTLEELLRRMNEIVSKRSVLWAIGEEMEPGDPVRILHLAERYGDIYNAILDWTAGLRTRRYSGKYSGAADLLSRLADKPIVAISNFSNSFVAAVSSHQRLATGTEGKWELWPDLSLRVDTELSADFDQAARRG